MFGLGTHELILIAVVVIVLFGATRLPQLGDAIGKGIRNFKRGMREVRDEEQQDREKQKALAKDEHSTSEDDGKIDDKIDDDVAQKDNAISSK